jgi:hypothetical protein
MLPFPFLLLPLLPLYLLRSKTLVWPNTSGSKNASEKDDIFMIELAVMFCTSLWLSTFQEHLPLVIFSCFCGKLGDRTP